MSETLLRPIAPAVEASRAPSGAERLLEALVQHGVDTVFGYPGGACLPIYDALHAETRIRHVLVRHEQAAVHAAEGYARSTGRPGVVLVTSGPGVSNTVTGLLDAISDSVPVVCISGQVATPAIGTDAFQECDALGLSRPVTKWNTQIRSVREIAAIVGKAFAVATQGRPGPVLIDFPKDLQMCREADAFSEAEQASDLAWRPFRFRPSASPKPRPCFDRTPPDLLRRRRTDQFRAGGLRAFRFARASHERTLHADTDRTGRLPGFRFALPRHARHARHARSESRDARRRPRRVRRRALRRPRHRQAGRVLSEGTQDPHRHRSDIDQQGRQGRRADGRRLRRSCSTR